MKYTSVFIYCDTEPALYFVQKKNDQASKYSFTFLQTRSTKSDLVVCVDAKNSYLNLICICHHVLLSCLWLLHFYRYFSPQSACLERTQIEYAPDWVVLSLLNIHLCFYVCVCILFGFFYLLHLNNDENSSVVPFLQYPMMYIVSTDSWLSLCIRRRGVLSGCTVQSGCDSLSLALPST